MDIGVYRSAKVVVYRIGFEVNLYLDADWSPSRLLKNSLRTLSDHNILRLLIASDPIC